MLNFSRARGLCKTFTSISLLQVNAECPFGLVVRKIKKELQGFLDL